MLCLFRVHCQSNAARGYAFEYCGDRWPRAAQRQCSRAVAAIRAQYSVEVNETLFVGDDTNDCAVRSECGYLYAVNDAATELVNICDVQLKTAGGAGVFKEVLARIHGH